MIGIGLAAYEFYQDLDFKLASGMCPWFVYSSEQNSFVPACL